MTLALKLKLAPTAEQLPVLNEMFWKWASICNRMGTKHEERESLKPPTEAKGVWFGRTQLWHAQNDINDHRSALANQRRRVEYEISSLSKRRDDIQAAVEDPSKRDVSPDRKDLFRPKAWVEKGLLKTRHHRASKWLKQTEDLNRQIKRMEDTAKRISAGKIRFKPKRMTLHQNSFRLKFGSDPKIMLSPLVGNRMEISIITNPMQPLIGTGGGKSSLHSSEYMAYSIKNFIAYSIDAMIFGFSDSQKMLMKARKPDKLEKKDKMIEKKKSGFAEKIKGVEKLAGRLLAAEEQRTLETKWNEFFLDFDRSIDEDYRKILEILSGSMVKNNSYMALKKYPILIRKPVQRYAHKKLKNLKPEQWEYYLQFGYEPVLDVHSGMQEKTVMGIDRGVTNLLAVAIFDPANNKFIFNKLYPNPVKEWKVRQRNLKHSITKLERRIRAQYNIHIFENQMKRQLHGVENRVENHYHEVSRELVELAKNYQSTIVIEAISGMKQHGRKKSEYTKNRDYSLSLFDYRKIADLINYKAERAGIHLRMIDPAGTSQNCAKCLVEGRDSKENYIRGKRETINGKEVVNMKKGFCKACMAKANSEIDADLNAARVIAVAYSKGLNNPRAYGDNIKFKSKPTQQI